MEERIVGIMGAMTEEISGIIELLENREKTVLGMRTYYSGKLNGVKTVVVFSRWGKVAATTTVSTLILEFKVTEIIFTGVAGAINSALRIGDIVIGKRLMQHDMDSRPMLPQYEVPLHRKAFFECDPTLLAIVSEAIETLLEQGIIEQEILSEFDIKNPKLFIGDIASGDQFFSSEEQKDALHSKIPSILCVEMEGAAVAQICFEYNIPWIVIRTISDTADEKSPTDFQAFIQKIASLYSTKMIKKIIQRR